MIFNDLIFLFLSIYIKLIYLKTKDSCLGRCHRGPYLTIVTCVKMFGFEVVRKLETHNFLGISVHKIFTLYFFFSKKLGITHSFFFFFSIYQNIKPNQNMKLNS